jgi:hypothetical protein
MRSLLVTDVNQQMAYHFSGDWSAHLLPSADIVTDTVSVLRQ